MLFATYILLLGILIKISGGKTNTSSRSKRYLISTIDTQYGAFVTASIPIHPESTVSMAWFFEANYYTVANVSFFQPLIGDVPEVGRKEREIENGNNLITRKIVYNFLEAMFERHGFGGRACLLRAICDNARSHFLHNGVLGDLLHLLLTPSTSESEDDIEDDFYVAEYLGTEDDCCEYKEECPESPLDYITFFL